LRQVENEGIDISDPDCGSERSLSRPRAHLPLHAQEIYLAAFNKAWAEYEARGSDQRERTAHRVAWAAVKRKYEKSGDHWIPHEAA